MKYLVEVLHDEKCIGSFVQELDSQNPEAIMIVAQDGVNFMVQEVADTGVNLDLNMITVDIEELE